MQERRDLVKKRAPLTQSLSDLSTKLTDLEDLQSDKSCPSLEVQIRNLEEERQKLLEELGRKRDELALKRSQAEEASRMIEKIDQVMVQNEQSPGKWEKTAKQQLQIPVFKSNQETQKTGTESTFLKMLREKTEEQRLESIRASKDNRVINQGRRLQFSEDAVSRVIRVSERFENVVPRRKKKPVWMHCPKERSRIKEVKEAVSRIRRGNATDKPLPVGSVGDSEKWDPVLWMKGSGTTTTTEEETNALATAVEVPSANLRWNEEAGGLVVGQDVVEEDEVEPKIAPDSSSDEEGVEDHSTTANSSSAEADLAVAQTKPTAILVETAAPKPPPSLSLFAPEPVLPETVAVHKELVLNPPLLFAPQDPFVPEQSSEESLKEVSSSIRKWIQSHLKTADHYRLNGRRMRKKLSVLIEGHSDEGIESEDLQLALSWERAVVMGSHLRQRLFNDESVLKASDCEIRCVGRGTKYRLNTEFGDSWRNRRCQVFLIEE